MNAPIRHDGAIAAHLSDAGWKALSKPNSIALVGASGRASSVSFTSRFLQTNQDLGYEGEIYLINPNRQEILGRKCWPDLASLPTVPDVVIINLPDEKVLPAVHEAIAKGSKALMIHSGGFGERGEAGLMREAELKDACARAQVAALGPNCLGMMNLNTRVSLSSFRASADHKAGPIALISQSGSVASILMHVAARHGISFVASTGNEAVTSTEDLIERAVDDPETRLIVCFVEALRQPRRLFGLAERARIAGKAIVVLKAGLTEKGGEVSRGHTGALAGSGAVYRQAFEQAGVVLVEDFDELAQTVELLMAFQDLPSGARVGMLGTSGGELGNITDMCETLEIELPELAPDTIVALQKWLVLPEDVEPRNPVDAGTGFNFSGTYEDRMRGAIRAVASDPSIDIVVVVQGFHKEGEDLRLSLNREIMGAAAKEALSGTKPVVAIACQSGRFDDGVMAEIRAAGVPALQGAREGLRALSHLSKLRVARARPVLEPRAAELSVTVPAHWDNGLVSQGALFSLLSDAGLRVTRNATARSPEEAAGIAAKLGGSVVMKIDTPRVIHKSDIGGVALDVTAQTASEVFQRLETSVSPKIGSVEGEGVFVADQLKAGIEFYVGAKQDATFGAVVVVGIGGRLLEIMGQTALLVAPFDRAAARDAIRRSGAEKFLRGYRGGPVADLDALSDLICKVGQIAIALGDTFEVLDLNPVIITHEIPGGCIADARLILQKGSKT
ncbi:acetate--CoA ligase family protein [Mesorhizobium sp. CAU 1732]|uniref:acetate--CoA ligase family protein n=1 Tax=Mesorhizobium sp. CAU 1732 TaxID=3140358 RepID=UPI003260299F